MLLMAALLLLAGCNKEEDSSLKTVTMNVPAVAVTNFYLRSDNKVLNGLDSVFFSIDLENGVIFNADSLPKGTKVDKLIPVMTFSSTVETATIEMTGGNTRTGSVDYKKNPTDSIDFSGRVQLILTSTDDLTRTYDIKVNVHRSEPDSLTWGHTAYAALPSAGQSPRSQRTLQDGSTYYCMTEENDGSYSLATSSDLFAYQWNRRSVPMPAGSRLESLCIADGYFYILDSGGNLFKASPASMNWESTGETWIALTGVYDGHVLGLALRGDKVMHTHYPAGGNIIDTPANPNFPVKGYTSMQPIENNWTNEPTGFLFGGETASGDLSSSVWAFDGESWIEINNGGVPAISGAVLCPYYNYRKTSTSWIQTEYRAWLLFGGRLSDGSLNRTLYLSYDNGVNWRKAPDLMQLPEFIPGLVGADCLLGRKAMESNLDEAWTRAMMPKDSRRRLAYEIDGYDISWECPYLFLFGGHVDSGALNTDVWCGVLERLRFIPLI